MKKNLYKDFKISSQSSNMVLIGGLILLFSLLTFAPSAFAQKKEKKERIKLEHANELEGDKRNGEKVNILRGNVIFSQKGAMMYCDSAYQYKKRNSIDAFGNVKVNQGDTISL